MLKVKICGVTSAANAAAVVEAGADFVGLNFWPRSRRYLAPALASEVAAAIRGAGGAVVGLFVDAALDEIAAVHQGVGLDVVQLHGDEPPAAVDELTRRLRLPVWKAVPLADAGSLEHVRAHAGAAAVLLDAPSVGRGGSGQRIPLSLAQQARREFPELSLVLAGGLTPATVAEAVSRVAPWAVDAASGVEEAPGLKDPALVRAFVSAARSAAIGGVLRD